MPVVIITASDDDDTSREAEILGCVAYLRKPFLGRSMVSLLRTLVSEGAASQQ